MSRRSQPRKSSPSIDELARDRRSGYLSKHEDMNKTSINFDKEDNKVLVFYPNRTDVIRNALRFYFHMDYGSSEEKELFDEVMYLKECLKECDENDPVAREFYEKELKTVKQKISNGCIKQSNEALDGTITVIENTMNSNRDKLAKSYDSKLQQYKNMKNAKRKPSGTKPLGVLEPISPIAILTFLSTRYENMKAGLGSWLSFMASVGYSVPEAMVAGALSASLVYLSYKYKMWTYRPFKKKPWVPTALSGTSLVLPRARFAITDRISKIVTRTVYSLCGAYVTLLAAGPIVVDLAAHL